MNSCSPHQKHSANTSVAEIQEGTKLGTQGSMGWNWESLNKEAIRQRAWKPRYSELAKNVMRTLDSDRFPVITLSVGRTCPNVVPENLTCQETTFSEANWVKLSSEGSELGLPKFSRCVKTSDAGTVKRKTAYILFNTGVLRTSYIRYIHTDTHLPEIPAKVPRALWKVQQTDLLAETTPRVESSLARSLLCVAS